MQLKNPFSDDTRLLYLYRYNCDSCGSNKMLELHHITGRTSNSPLNASLVCHECHSHMAHSVEEESRLFAINLRFLFSQQYQLTKKDMTFLEDNPRLWKNNNDLIQWLRQ